MELIESRARGRVVGWLALAAMESTVGCGSKSSAEVTSGVNAGFSVCESSPAAVRYVPGISALSMSGAFRALIESASTELVSGSTVSTAAIGDAKFSVAVTAFASGDAGAPPPDGLTMTTPPIPGTDPADPYMPLHGHGASTVPTIAAQGSGIFSVSQIDFFMGGYWQLYLELMPPDGAPDPLTFNLCIPDD